MLAHHKNPDLRARQHEPDCVSLHQNGEPGDEALVPWHATSPVVERILNPTAKVLYPDTKAHLQSLPTSAEENPKSVRLEDRNCCPLMLAHSRVSFDHSALTRFPEKSLPEVMELPTKPIRIADFSALQRQEIGTDRNCRCFSANLSGDGGLSTRDLERA